MSEERASIAAIPADVCRRICTGQVVSTLSAACKELIDNALDAGANTIEVRIRSFGSESMEVLDNGSGIHSSDFEALCKAHATSKLADISDFSHLATFGFRGEALNALCAISSVTVTTRHKDEAVATRLVYDHNGCITSRESCARPAGTTVLVSNLFETLPVRRKELERTSKKEFCKLLTVVQTFALSRTDVRFSVSSISNGKRHQVLSTPGGNASIKDVLVSLFGSRSDKNAVLDIVQKTPDDEICAIYGLSAENSTPFFDEIRLRGYVSSCVHGHGRSSADRQFVYFNRRPVHYPKLCRIANEVYQQYNQGQYCMLVLFVEVPPESIDVNVAPDKRSVFYEREKELFAVVRSSLLATFAPCLGQTQSVEAAIKKSACVMVTGTSCTDGEATVVNYVPIAEDESLPYGPTQPFQVIVEDGVQIGPPTTVTYAIDKPVHAVGPLFQISDRSSHRKRPSNEDTGNHDMSEEDISKKRATAKRLEQFAFSVMPHASSDEATDCERTERSKAGSIITSSDASAVGNGSESGRGEQKKVTEVVNDSGTLTYRHPSLGFLVERATRSDMFSLTAAVDTEAVIVGKDKLCRTPSPHSYVDIEQPSSSAHPQALPEHRAEMGSSSTVMRTQQTVAFAMSDLTNRMHEVYSQRSSLLHAQRNKNSVVPRPVFSASSQQNAEDELDANLTKEDFSSMEVIGQFNKGFIITRLRGDLFIVDQHASDEKFNFERFQKKARIQSQLLLSPRALNIGALEEAVLRDNIEIFNYNGFEFRYDDEDEPGRRVLLTSVPVLNNCQLDTSDISEMLSVLSTYPGTMYRPTKLRKLFASRACRKSVMIGTALSTSQMEKIVRHLGELDHPWNCPHGRPTLRHLCSLAAHTNLRNQESTKDGLLERTSPAQLE